MTTISYGSLTNDTANRFNIDFSAWLLNLEELKNKNKCESTDLHLVLYTDGGCRPSPGGDAGWGIHGYIFTMDKPKAGHGCKTAIPHAKGYVNTGSANSEGGSIPPITVLNYIDVKGGLAAPSSNNEAELYGLVDALDIVANIKPVSVHFLLDSEYVLKGANEWLNKWISNNWKKPNGDVVSNKETWLTVKQQLETVTQTTKLTWGWVKGHSDNMGNILADYNATSGIYSIKNTGLPKWSDATIHPVKNYWSPVSEAHPLLGASCFYFRIGSQPELIHVSDHTEFNLDSATPTAINRYAYHIGTGGRKDDGKYFGKPDPEAAFCTILVKDKIKELETIRDAQNKYCDTINGGTVILARLDNILSGFNLREIGKYGADILHGGTKGGAIINGRDEIFSRSLDPARKSLEAIQTISAQETNLLNIIQDKKFDFYTCNEITSYIYDQVVKYKNAKAKNSKSDDFDVLYVVKKELGGDNASMEINVSAQLNSGIVDKKITLNFGIDAPRVNFFNRIAEHHPRVFVYTYPLPESDKAFRYSVLITINDGVDIEYALWEAPYSNIRVLV